MTELTFFYLNISEVEVEGGKHLTEIGWVIEDPLHDQIAAFHYFADHPGGTDADNLVIDAVGSNMAAPPRYSMSTLLRMLLDDLPTETIIVVKTPKHKRMLLKYMVEDNHVLPVPVHLMADVLTHDDKLDILTLMEEARARAMTPTGRTE